MDIKYSGKIFEGYTHKFIVEVYDKKDWNADNTMFIDIYTNDASFFYLKTFLNQRFNKTIYNSRIASRVRKVNNEKTEHIINEILKLDNEKI